MTDQLPLAPERRAHVLAALERDGAVRVSQLLEELGAAPVTLRRDLAQLEREGLLVRVHGGAVAPKRGAGAPTATGTESGPLALGALAALLLGGAATLVARRRTASARSGRDQG